MKDIRKNLISNYVGTIWISLLQLVSIPLYLKLLGEALWGVLSILIMFNIVIGAIGAGMAQVVPREISYRINDFIASRDVAFGFERLYWISGILLSVIIYVISPFVVEFWLDIEGVLGDEAVFAMRMMALQFFVQWPLSCYQGILLGRQNHVTLNKIQVYIASVRYLSIIAVMYYISASIFAYQLLMIITLFIEVAITRNISWRLLGGRSMAKWSPIEMDKLYKFTIGVTLTVVTGVLVVQADKFLLSGLIEVGDYGYYSVICTASFALLQLVYPLNRTVYPAYSEMAGKCSSPRKLNITMIGIVSKIIAPIGAIMIFFSDEILFLWTWNSLLVDKASGAFSLLVIGTILNIFYHIPYLNLLASGKTSMPLVINVISLVIISILVPLLVSRYGVNGAALAWLGSNLLSVVVGYYWMIQRSYYSVNEFIRILFNIFIIFITIFLLHIYISGYVGLFVVFILYLIYLYLSIKNNFLVLDLAK